MESGWYQPLGNTQRVVVGADVKSLLQNPSQMLMIASFPGHSSSRPGPGGNSVVR
jgi:hypothetical protein